MAKKTSNQAPDWDRLTKMINELAVRKGLTRAINDDVKRAERGDAAERIEAISYRKLGIEIGKSPTILYGIMDRYHRPAPDTLAALADYAKRSPRIDHLADRGQWLLAGGIISELSPWSEPLDDAERRILSLLLDLSPEEKARMFQAMQSVKDIIRSPAESAAPRREKAARH